MSNCIICNQSFMCFNEFKEHIFNKHFSQVPSENNINNINNELELKKDFIREAKKHKIFAQLIESPSITTGIPDMYMIFDEISSWIEFKNYKYNYKNSNSISTLTHQQISWLTNNAKHGGLSFIFIAYKNLYLMTTIQNIDISNKSIKNFLMCLRMSNIDFIKIKEYIRIIYTIYS